MNWINCYQRDKNTWPPEGHDVVVWYTIPSNHGPCLRWGIGSSVYIYNEDYDKFVFYTNDGLKIGMYDVCCWAEMEIDMPDWLNQ